MENAPLFRRKTPRNPFRTAFLVSLIAIGVIIYAHFVSGAASSTNSAAPVTVVQVTDEQSQVINVVKHSSPAVVSVNESAQVPNVLRCITPNEQGQQDYQDSIGNWGFCQYDTTVQRVAAASGFLVSSDGYVITNNHVVADTSGSYSVTLNDQQHLGKKYQARIVLRDAKDDIAVLKIDAGKTLPTLGFSDSSKLQVGQTAIAIGYALGEFNNTVSKGVVSGLDRSITALNSLNNEVETLNGLIQTDAGINLGNSGGPLLDITGNVIGMNTAVADAQSIGFAIPSNTLVGVYAQAKGK